MSEQSAEEVAHAHASAVVAGDIGTTVRSMTPDALAKAMQLGNTSWVYFSYELERSSQDGEDHLFDVLYTTDIERLKLRYRFRRLDGRWTVVDLDRLD